MAIHFFGIRHHGPGSSAHLMQGLQALQPDIILVEGPPEGEPMLGWVNHPDMQPPVALLAYVPDQPDRAVFYPFASYSPEWNAIKYGIEQKLPVRFIDMPLVHKLAVLEIEADVPTTGGDDEELKGHGETESFLRLEKSPMSHLAQIAGFSSEDEWWEHQFELNEQESNSFEAIQHAMEALREAFPSNQKTEKIREAFMRRGIQTAQREMYHTIAVVCGAWHVPALQKAFPKKEDDALLKNLSKIKVETCWIPWTNERLQFESGYGAGIQSPGWYQHVWDHPQDDGARWLSLTAQVFRNNRVDISSAHIIEAVRLAQALATMRQLQQPGLNEMNEATSTVMCMGDDILLQVIKKELIVGQHLGQTPEQSPQPALYADFEKQAKTLRLKISNEAKNIVLDLREPFDLQKSIFLHRLGLLEVPWGSIQYSRSKGTFKEEWQLYWQPEFTLKVLEKAPWGNTIEWAADEYLAHLAAQTTNLPDITNLAQKALPAELAKGTQAVMKRLDELAASTSDTNAMLDAFIPLVQIQRYGNVRNTDQALVAGILQSVFYRMIAGLPSGTAHINEDLAAEMAGKIRQVHDGVLLLDNEFYKTEWFATVTKMLAGIGTEPIIQGSCSKILYDQKLQSTAETALQFRRTIAVNTDPNFTAQWLEGFLHEGAGLLLFDDDLLVIINNWLQSVLADDFLKILPVLRRTFASIAGAERRKLAQKIFEGTGTAAPKLSTASTLNEVRAMRMLPMLKKLMLFSK